MPHVYVPNRGAHDYSAAERFGTLIFCTEGSLQKYNTSQMVRELQSHLSFSEFGDYILLTSLTTLCSLACAIFAKKHGCLNLLIFKDDDYVCRRVVL